VVTNFLLTFAVVKNPKIRFCDLDGLDIHQDFRGCLVVQNFIKRSACGARSASYRIRSVRSVRLLGAALWCRDTDSGEHQTQEKEASQVEEAQQVQYQRSSPVSYAASTHAARRQNQRRRVPAYYGLHCVS